MKYSQLEVTLHVIIVLSEKFFLFPRGYKQLLTKSGSETIYQTVTTEKHFIFTVRIVARHRFDRILKGEPQNDMFCAVKTK